MLLRSNGDTHDEGKGRQKSGACRKWNYLLCSTKSPLKSNWYTNRNKGRFLSSIHFSWTWTLDVTVHLALLLFVCLLHYLYGPQDRNLANIVPTDNKPSSLAKQKKKRRCHSLSLCPPNSSRNYCSKRTVLSAQLMMKVRGKWNERGNHRQRHHRKKSLQKKTCCNHISNQFYVSITKYKLLHRTRLRNLLIVIHQK